MANILACQARDRRFESGRGRQMLLDSGWSGATIHILSNRAISNITSTSGTSSKLFTKHRDIDYRARTWCRATVTDAHLVDYERDSSVSYKLWVGINSKLANGRIQSYDKLAQIFTVKK